MGLENLKSIFSPDSKGSSTNTNVLNQNSTLGTVIPFQKTNLINLNSQYDNLVGIRSTNITSFLSNSELDDTLPFNRTQFVSNSSQLNFDSGLNNISQNIMTIPSRIAINSSIFDTIGSADTTVLNGSNLYSNVNNYSNLTSLSNQSNLENSAWNALYNSDGTAKSDTGLNYPFVSRGNLDKKYKSQTSPNWSRTSLLGGNEPYEWSNIGQDSVSVGGNDLSFLGNDRRFPAVRALKDVSRIGKYLTSTDGVVNFIGGQNILGALSRVQYYDDGKLFDGKQRFQAQYNPLSTLTAVGSRFAGIGLPNYLMERDPFPISLNSAKKYTDVVGDTVQNRFTSPAGGGGIENMFTDYWNTAIGNNIEKERPGGDPHTLMGFGNKADAFGLKYKDTIDEAFPTQIGKIENKKYGMPFYFKDLRDGAFIILRGYLEAITENVSPSWATQNFLGRSEPSYIYERAERDVSFSLKLYANTKSELGKLYQKINRLTSMCYPEYKHDQHLITDSIGKNQGQTQGSFDTSTFESPTQYSDELLRMKAPFVKMRIGELYGSRNKEVLGFFRSLTYSVPEESTWETEVGKRVPRRKC